MLKRSRGAPGRGSLAKTAERFLRRQVEIEDLSPLHDAPAARAEHAARMSEAQVALREGRCVAIFGRMTPECHRRRERALWSPERA